MKELFKGREHVVFAWSCKLICGTVSALRFQRAGLAQELEIGPLEIIDVVSDPEKLRTLFSELQNLKLPAGTATVVQRTFDKALSDLHDLLKSEEGFVAHICRAAADLLREGSCAAERYDSALGVFADLYFMELNRRLDLITS